MRKFVVSIIYHFRLSVGNVEKIQLRGSKQMIIFYWNAGSFIREYKDAKVEKCSSTAVDIMYSLALQSHF